MKTVCECLKDWLGEYKGADFSEILTDFIGAPEECLAVFKSPNKEVVPFIDGSKQVTEYYQFFVRRATQIQSQNNENQRLLADLEDWSELQEEEEHYPDLSEAGKMTCTEIKVSNSATISSQEDDNAIYQITISIQYLKER